VIASRYRIPLPVSTTGLAERIATFLAAERIEEVQLKKGVEKLIDLRADVLDITLLANELELKLAKGSPLRVAAWLLQRGVEEVRQLGVRKTAIECRP
jgi:hypothetical protein